MVAGKYQVTSSVRQVRVLPQSCTSIYINILGFLSFLLSLYILRQFPQLGANERTLICLMSFALPIIYLETFVMGVYRRPSTGLDYSQVTAFSLTRVGLKILSLYFTFAIIGLIYWLFPVYHTAFYQPYWLFLQQFLPWFFLLSIPYVIFVDRHQHQPEDVYWRLGRLFLGSTNGLQAAEVKQFALGWLVKAFFLPLMMAYFIRGVEYLVTVQYDFVIANFNNTYQFFWEFLFTTDLLIACVGYVLTLRLLDSHIRSAEPTLFGWLVALICYEPFWTVIYGSYLAYNVDNIAWGNWLAGEPKLAFAWGCGILFLLTLYAFSTLAFGLRFSNLTHRGIITNGMYAICKHPAYVAKNILWWMVSVPFISLSGTRVAIANCILLLLVNLIYFLRAKTEERHLSRDPVYVEYALAMNRRSIFRFFSFIPFIAYRAPDNDNAMHDR